MKHLIKFFSVLCLLGMISQANAQSLDLGVKAGINYASISDLNSDGRVGFTGGAFANVRFNTLGLQVEALFSQQGGELDEIDIETDYLLVPVLAKLHFLRIFNLQFGPQFSYLLNEDHPLESEELDVSGAVGLGLNLGSSLRLDARYNFGFTDAFKGASGKNRFISVALGLSFL